MQNRNKKNIQTKVDLVKIIGQEKKSYFSAMKKKRTLRTTINESKKNKVD